VSATGQELAAEVAAQQWYHSIELPGGLLTPGYFDTRAAAKLVPLPERLDGMRCLDVGTYDGFWAFEMERRGAASVTAIDVLEPERWDWPVGSDPETIEAIGAGKRESRGFEIARAALGSGVERLDLSVNELDPDSHGRFDVVYLGSLLIHLRDPIGALERVCAVCSGELVLHDAIDQRLDRTRPAAMLDGQGRPWWWKPNLLGLGRMVEAAGFELVAGPSEFYMPFGAGWQAPKLRLRDWLTPTRREVVTYVRRGDPHAALRARPI
jgi:tRNA (mo5U34)-methyltransferase